MRCAANWAALHRRRAGLGRCFPNPAGKLTRCGPPPVQATAGASPQVSLAEPSRAAPVLCGRAWAVSVRALSGTGLWSAPAAAGAPVVGRPCCKDNGYGFFYPDREDPSKCAAGLAARSREAAAAAAPPAAGPAKRLSQRQRLARPCATDAPCALLPLQVLLWVHRQDNRHLRRASAVSAAGQRGGECTAAHPAVRPPCPPVSRRLPRPTAAARAPSSRSPPTPTPRRKTC